MTCFSAVPPPPASAPRLSTSKSCRASNSSNQRWLEVPILRNANGSARSRSGNRAPAGQYRTGSRGSAAVAMAMSVKRPECRGVVQDRFKNYPRDPSGLRVLNVADADQGDRRRACRGRRCSQSVAAVAVRTLQVRQRGCRRVGNDLRSTEWGHCGDGSAWRARQAWRTTDGLFQHDRVAHPRAGRLDAERREPDNTVGADSRHHLQLTGMPQLVRPAGPLSVVCRSTIRRTEQVPYRLVADVVAHARLLHVPRPGDQWPVQQGRMDCLECHDVAPSHGYSRTRHGRWSCARLGPAIEPAVGLQSHWQVHVACQHGLTTPGQVT